MGNPIEITPVVTQTLGSSFRSRADAEQHVEHDPGIAQHRQRSPGAGPTHGIGVDAGVVVIATSGLIDRLNAKLQGLQRRVLSVSLRKQLIHRRAAENVGPLRLFRVRLRQKYGARAKMISSEFSIVTACHRQNHRGLIF